MIAAGFAPCTLDYRPVWRCHVDYLADPDHCCSRGPGPPVSGLWTAVSLQGGTEAPPDVRVSQPAAGVWVRTRTHGARAHDHTHARGGPAHEARRGPGQGVPRGGVPRGRVPRAADQHVPGRIRTDRITPSDGQTPEYRSVSEHQSIYQSINF